MKKILGRQDTNLIIDHLFVNHMHHPATYGHEELVFTSPDDINSEQRLDYILQIIPNKPDIKRKFNPVTESCTVQKFTIKDRKFTHLSDHYGVSIECCFEPQ